MGLCMSSVVYFCVILGQLVFFMIVLIPDMKETYQIESELEKMSNPDYDSSAFTSGEDDKWNISWNFSPTQVEWIFYELATFMLIWSHLSTMCRDPGFIPINYEYDEIKLAKPFRLVRKDF